MPKYPLGVVQCCSVTEYGPANQGSSTNMLATTERRGCTPNGSIFWQVGDSCNTGTHQVSKRRKF